MQLTYRITAKMNRRSIDGNRTERAKTRRASRAKSHSQGRVSIVGLVALLAIMTAGCNYSSRYTERLSSGLRAGSILAYLKKEPIGVNDDKGKATGVDIQLPIIFDEHAQLLGTGDDPTRSSIPGKSIPGLSYSYERKVDIGGGRFAGVYFYAYAVSSETMDGDTFKQTLVEQLQSDYETVSIERLAGGTATWTRIVSQQSQPFAIQSGQAESTEQLDGSTQVYVATNAKHSIAFAFRYPLGAEEKIQPGFGSSPKFSEAIKASIATVRGIN